MNKIIKFRAWNKEKKIMCYDNEDYEASYWDGVFSSDVGLINRYLDLPEEIKTYEYMQYIGFEDKNKREIYEGDIIKERSGGCVGIVRFGEYDNSDYGDKYYGLYIEWISKIAKSYKKNIWFWLNDIGIEVVGNIFDNPELLNQ